MNGEDIFGLILMFLSCFGCALLFLGIGRWAETSKTPFGFWTGKAVKPGSIQDIPAYNRENGRMWKRYSLPYFLAGLCSIGGIWFPGCLYFAAILLVTACTLGFLWLIRKYRIIFRKYSSE